MANWSHEDKSAAWWKTTPIAGSDDRSDCDGRRIRWADYGKDTEFGWEIDHHPIPQVLGRCDEHWNLRARHKVGNALAGGILGNAMKENRLGLLGGLAGQAPPRNALAEALRQPPRDALMEGIFGPATNAMTPFKPSGD